MNRFCRKSTYRISIMDIPTFEEVFAQIKTNFWVFGLPLNTTRILIRFFVLIFAVFLMISEETAFFVSKISSDNFLVLVELASCIVNAINTFIKIICISLKRRKINELATSLLNINNEVLKDEKKISVIKRPNVILKKLVKYYFKLNAIFICVYNFSTLVIIAYHYFTTKEIIYLLPYAILVPFSIDTWKPWLLVYIHSISCGFVTVLYATTVDTLYYVFTSHVCSNFAVLSNEIISLDKTNSHKLADIVKRHQNILKLSEDLEDIFSKPNLSNVLSGSLNICALGFCLTAGETNRIPGVFLFLMYILLQMFLLSVFGENLMQESAKVADSAYFCQWYEMDKKYRKQILIIINRSSKPQRLTAYKFSLIGYESFSKIISTSWSYFTILRTVYKPSE